MSLLVIYLGYIENVCKVTFLNRSTVYTPEKRQGTDATTWNLGTLFLRPCVFSRSTLSLDCTHWIRLYASPVQRLYLFFKLLFLKHLHLTLSIIIFCVIWLTNNNSVRLKASGEKMPFVITVLPTSCHLKQYLVLLLDNAKNISSLISHKFFSW